MQVKILHAQNEMSLENKVNAALAELRENCCIIINVQFQHSYMIGQYSQPSYAVMITYGEVDDV